MRLPITLSTLALLTAGLSGQAAAQHAHDEDHGHDHGAGSGEVHSHLERIFKSDAADAPDAPDAPAAQEAHKAHKAPVAQPVRLQDKERGFMGVNMSVEDGAMLIQGVIDGTPAAKAKLESGDRVTRIQGKPITDQQSLTALLGGFGPGETVLLSVERNGWTKEVKLTLASRSDFDVEQPSAERRRSGGEGQSGQSDEIREKIRRKLEQRESQGGGRSFFGDASESEDAAEEHQEIEVEVKREGSQEPQIRIRVNGEDVDLEDLEDLDLDGVFMLKDLDGLKELKGLKGLEGLHGDHRVMTIDPHEVESWTDEDGNTSIFVHRGDHDDDGHHADGHAPGEHGNLRFGRGHGAESDEVSGLRDELRELRRELHELRRERMHEIEGLRKEVQELLRSVQRGR